MKLTLNRLRQAFRSRIFSQPRLLFFSLDQASANGVTEASDRIELLYPDLDALLAWVADLPRQAAQAELFRARYSSGDQAVISLIDKKMVHLAWYGQRDEICPDYELGKQCIFPVEPKSAVIYDCWTPESVRGCGYYPQTLRKLTTVLLQKYVHLWIYCLIENQASRRGIEKAGFAFVTELKGLRVFGRFGKCCRQ